MMIVNNPDILAEVTASFEEYEAALGANDLTALGEFFWVSESAVRYGTGEALYGYDQIHAFRVARPGGSPSRTILRQVITTFGSDLATTNIEFRRAGSERVGRQSQTWVRLAEGWRVVSGHISFQEVS